MKVIAICGAKRAGKDTVSNILGNLYGFHNVKISTDLKECCKLLFGFDDDQLETDIKDVIDPVFNCKPRELMQFIGTDVMQFHIQSVIPNIGRAFWIRKTINRINKLSEEENIDKIVISDLRFMHEYELLKSTYGRDLSVWKIIRPSVNETKESKHCSEQEWKKIPYDKFLMNSREYTLKDLEDLVKRNYS